MMKMWWMTFQNSPWRLPLRAKPSGLTLIEVIAALAILALLLGGVMTAKRSARQQWGRAGHQLQALTMLDEMLADLSQLQTAWAPGTGPIEASPEGWTWQIEMMSTPTADALQAQVATVQIVDAQQKVLAQVQMLVPNDSPQAQGNDDG